jgi:hypothetical protein
VVPLRGKNRPDMAPVALPGFRNGRDGAGQPGQTMPRTFPQPATEPSPHHPGPCGIWRRTQARRSG